MEHIETQSSRRWAVRLYIPLLFALATSPLGCGGRTDSTDSDKGLGASKSNGQVTLEEREKRRLAAKTNEKAILAAHKGTAKGRLLFELHVEYGGTVAF